VSYLKTFTTKKKWKRTSQVVQFILSSFLIFDKGKAIKFNELRPNMVIHWNNNHFVVLYKIENDKFHIGNPAYG